MKIKLLIFISFFISANIYSQNNIENPALPSGKKGVVKELLLYIEGNSGVLTGDTFGQFTGNESIIALRYQQTFQKASWLGFYVKTALKGSIAFNHRNLNTGNDQIVFPEYELNGVSGAKFGADFLEVGLYTDYGYLSLKHNLLIQAFLFYPIKVKNITFQLITGVEALPYFVGQEKLSDTVDGLPSAQSIENLMAGFSINVDIGSGWSFLTDVQYRTHGGGTADRSIGTAWEVDSLDALKYNSSIRWENKISYNHRNKYYFWGLVRYEAKYFIDNPDTSTLVSRPHHLVSLLGGITFTFDFSTL